MSFMDKIKSLFSGGSSDSSDAHAGHDHSGSDHPAHDHDEVAATMPAADPAPDEPIGPPA